MVVFDFSVASGRGARTMRVRIDDFTYVSAIAEMNNGELYMAKSFVQAKGA